MTNTDLYERIDALPDDHTPLKLAWTGETLPFDTGDLMAMATRCREIEVAARLCLERLHDAEKSLQRIAVPGKMQQYEAQDYFKRHGADELAALRDALK